MKSPPLPWSSTATRIVFCTFLAILWSGYARAETFEVTNTNDSGSGSLRQAILDSNASADAANTITFSVADNSTVTLLSPLPDISKTLTIDGTTAANLTVRGDGMNQIFRVAGDTTTVRDLGLGNGTLEVSSGAALAFDLSADGQFDDVITDAGALQKRGTATLTLLGANDYTGGTSVSGGTLRGNTTSLQGDITNNARVLFDQDMDGTYSDVISGTGTLEKSGTATLTLTGANTYSGGTMVSEGTLQGDTASLQGDIANSALVVFDQSADGTFSGAISGSGSVEKKGTAVLILDGANSYSGGTTVSAGTLQGSSTSIPGDVALATSTSLVFDQAGSGTHSGSISGAGEVVKQGAGELTLAGSNSHTGGTQVLAGTLRGDSGSLVGDISNESALVFDQGSGGTYAGAISGAGGVQKLGAGTLTWTGIETYAGATTISGGRLEVDGQLQAGPADVTVASGASLGGTGTIDRTVLVDGTVGPGNSIGELTVASVTFNSGSVLEVELNEAGSADLLTVTDTATINDASVLVRPEPGAYLAPVTVPILTAATKTGDFDPTPIPDFAFLFEELMQDDTSATLTIGFNGNTLSSFAETPNQAAVALVLDNSKASASGDLETVFQNLNTLTVDEVAPALDDMGGEPLTEFATTGLAIGARLNRTIQSRIRAQTWHETDTLLSGSGGERAPVLGGSPRILAAPRSLIPDPENEQTGLGAWLDGYGIFGDIDGDSDTNDLDYDIWGSSLGIDYRFTDQLLIGAAGGYAHTDIDFDDPSGSGDADTFEGALYGGYVTPRYYLGVSALYAQSDIDSSRRIVFATINRTARADFDGYQVGAYVEAGLNAFEFGRMAFQPLVSFDYAHIHQDSYTEKGAGSLNLAVDSEDVDSYVSGVGARIHGTFDMGDGSWLIPEIRGRWVHEYGDRDRKIGARISGATTGGSFTVRGAELPRDSAVFSASWTVITAENLHVFVGWDTIINRELFENSVALGLRITW